MTTESIHPHHLPAPFGREDDDPCECPPVAPTRPVTVRRVVFRAVSWSLFLSVIAIWAMYFRPVSMGGPMSMLAVSGTSMEPTYQPGDFLVVRHIAEFHVGDIVVYEIPPGEPGAGERVVHRIVGGNGVDGFVLQGDNNSNVDQWRPKHDEIVGQVWLRVPRLASWLMIFRDPTFLAVVIGLGVFALLLFPERKRESMWRWWFKK